MYTVSKAGLYGGPLGGFGNAVEPAGPRLPRAIQSLW
jgi:hypothetical protein